MITVNEDIDVELGQSIEAEAELSLFASLGALSHVNDGVDGGTPEGNFPEPDEDPLLIQLQVRRGVRSLWDSENPTLRVGELGLITDEKRFVIGDGINEFVDLYADEDNVYVPKKYLDEAIFDVYDYYDLTIVEIQLQLVDLNDRVSQLESDAAAKPTYAMNVSPVSPTYDGTNQDYQTPSPYKTGTLMVYKGGLAAMALCPAYTEIDETNFRMDRAPESDDVLILMYEKL